MDLARKWTSSRTRCRAVASPARSSVIRSCVHFMSGSRKMASRRCRTTCIGYRYVEQETWASGVAAQANCSTGQVRSRQGLHAQSKLRKVCEMVQGFGRQIRGREDSVEVGIGVVDCSRIRVEQARPSTCAGREWRMLMANWQVPCCARNEGVPCVSMDWNCL